MDPSWHQNLSKIDVPKKMTKDPKNKNNSEKAGNNNCEQKEGNCGRRLRGSDGDGGGPGEGMAAVVS